MGAREARYLRKERIPDRDPTVCEVVLKLKTAVYREENISVCSAAIIPADKKMNKAGFEVRG